jgi:hypothetical protein
MATIGALPDELLLDIFARLRRYPVDLLRCAATSTRWLRLVAADDAALLRRAGVLPENKNASLVLGAFYQTENPVIAGPTATESKPADCPPKFWRLADDVDLPGSGLFSILPNHDGLLSYASLWRRGAASSSLASCPRRWTTGSSTSWCATLSSVACTMFRRLPCTCTPRSKGET